MLLIDEWTTTLVTNYPRRRGWAVPNGTGTGERTRKGLTRSFPRYGVCDYFTSGNDGDKQIGIEVATAVHNMRAAIDARILDIRRRWNDLV